jgi:hypothetical protein
MRSTALPLVLACLVATPAAADVTITANSTGKAPMMDLSGVQVTRIKGNKMRMDLQNDGKETTMIIDVDGQRMIGLDSRKKEAEVTLLGKLQETLGKITSGEVRARITPTAEKKTIAGIACTVHNLAVDVPFDMSGNGQMPATINMTGPACLTKDAPGYADYVRFYTLAADKGFIFTNPRGAQGPGAASSRGMATLHRTLAEAGIPVEQAMNAKLTGEGPIAMMGKLFNITAGHTVTKIETTDIPADVFEIPAGYKVKQNN